MASPPNCTPGGRVWIRKGRFAREIQILDRVSQVLLSHPWSATKCKLCVWQGEKDDSKLRNLFLKDKAYESERIKELYYKGRMAVVSTRNYEENITKEMPQPIK